VLELSDGRSVERSLLEGSDAFEATLPCPVRVVTAELVGRLFRASSSPIDAHAADLDGLTDEERTTITNVITTKPKPKLRPHSGAS
jgi:hypothetical protein